MSRLSTFYNKLTIEDGMLENLAGSSHIASTSFIKNYNYTVNLMLPQNISFSNLYGVSAEDDEEMKYLFGGQEFDFFVNEIEIPNVKIGGKPLDTGLIENGKFLSTYQNVQNAFPITDENKVKLKLYATDYSVFDTLFVTWLQSMGKNKPHATNFDNLKSVPILLRGGLTVNVYSNYNYGNSKFSNTVGITTNTPVIKYEFVGIYPETIDMPNFTQDTDGKPQIREVQFLFNKMIISSPQWGSKTRFIFTA